MASASFVRLAVLGAMTFALGCEDPLGPGDLAGTYEIRALHHSEAPVLLEELEVRSTWLLADTLRLHADGTGQRTWTRERRFVTGAVERQTFVQDVWFRIGDGITLDFACPRGAVCRAIAEPPYRVWRTPQGLLIYDPEGERGRLDYVRVD